MRRSFLSLIVLLLVSVAVYRFVEAETPLGSISANLSLGSKGAQVMLLQQILNADSTTRVAVSGPGSPGQETSYFGPMTRTAVVRFQEKYLRDILSPAGLSQGNGFVGAYTRAKLNALVPRPSTGAPVSGAPATASTTRTGSAAATTTQASPYAVTADERIDVFAGDNLLLNVQNRINAAIDAAVAARSASIAVPTISQSDLPSVSLQTLSPRAGPAGMQVTVSGLGIEESSSVYFGNDYVVRSVKRDIMGNITFAIPPIPPGRYDVAFRSGNAISNSVSFVLRDLSKTVAPVRIQSVTPGSVRFGSSVTIAGSGFAAKNVVVTRYQTFRDVPSLDGTTLSVTLAPATYRSSAEAGNGSTKIPVTVYIVNDNGFSNEKSFEMTL